MTVATATLTNDWVAVWQPLALGDAWLKEYDVWREGPLIRVRAETDQPHPRLVLPLALAAWGACLTTTPQKAAGWVGQRSLQDCLDLIPVDAALPLPCNGSGRCEAVFQDGQIRPAVGEDEAEAVARVLTHSCELPHPAPLAGDWTDRWLRMAWAPPAESALVTVAALRGADDLQDKVRRLAGGVRGEAELAEIFATHSKSSSGQQGFVRYMTMRKTGGREITCPTCGHVGVSRCSTCAAYPSGPRLRDSQLDRVEHALGER